MRDDHDLLLASTETVRRIVQAGKMLATAESCTGGWIAKALTDIGGSSAAIGYGLVSYSNEAKRRLLGVQPGTLARHGAVSEETVREMAEGALRISAADISVAVSGIAGPDGGTEEKPVGTVWFAWSARTGDTPQTSAEVQQFAGNRDDVRRQAVLHALAGIRVRLEE